MTTCDVAVVGAGPYGLSAAAHLIAADGLKIRVFGEPMSFWEQHMPTGMLLRSPLAGSHLSDPAGALKLHAYQAASGQAITAPLPLTRFAGYGRWFQSKAVPDLDSRKVDGIEKVNGKFRLTVEGGERWEARGVVVAAGIAPFAWRPPAFRPVSWSLASHTCDHRDLTPFAGKKIAVIGAGQSALESAALLHELHADVELLVRARQVRWLWKRPWVHTFKPIGRMLYAPPDVGQAGISHFVARPSLFRRLPRSLQNRLGVRSIRPAGAAWLKPRCQAIRMKTGCEVKFAVPSGKQLKLHLSDGTQRVVDHALLATGYHVDISKYPFLSTNLLGAIDRVGGFPILDDGFQSSVPGLFFLGAPSAWSFGPLMRFVAGAEFSSRFLTHKVMSHAKSNGHS